MKNSTDLSGSYFRFPIKGYDRTYFRSTGLTNELRTYKIECAYL